MNKPASEYTLDEIPPCEGTGKPWRNGTGAPICPKCHAGPGSLRVVRPRRYKGHWTGAVPAHPNLVVWTGRVDVLAWRQNRNGA